MADIDRWWKGVGNTPREAVRDLVPNTDEDSVAWVEGLSAFSDEEDPSGKPRKRRRDVTIIYESRRPKRWLVEVDREEGSWSAFLIGGKGLPQH